MYEMFVLKKIQKTQICQIIISKTMWKYWHKFNKGIGV
jgi:hypothetical protein